MSKKKQAWLGSVAQFMKVPEGDLVATLVSHHQGSQTDAPHPSQIHAWKTSIQAIHKALASIRIRLSNADNWTLVFEYELPRERGRRPDVLLLGNGWVLVLEFKDFSLPRPQHVDQVEAYARDLLHYHVECASLRVIPLLVLTKSSAPITSTGSVLITAGSSLAEAIDTATAELPSTALIDGEQWVAGDYAPLPSLISAARQIFDHSPLPHIRRAHSAGIPETIAQLIDIARIAHERGERHLALVTGVPGAGKTLVGLQFVYENHFAIQTPGKDAVFLSGNGPLVKVLQHALQSSVFVQDVHGFLRQYGGDSRRIPTEHIWVYDEAQRAWDATRVGEKRGKDVSEPEDFLKIGQRIERWAMMVGLIGEGQEIHLGEEAGLVQWNDAIAAVGGEWTVHCPSKLKQTFSSAASVQVDDGLDLTQSLRSHLAEDVQGWVKAVLDGHLSDAKQLAAHAHAQGFPIYLARNIELAKEYVRERYNGEDDKRFGLLASSKAKNLPPLGVHNEYNFTKNLREGPWYNDPPNSKNSCCQLKDVATEFACQGLELDMPIVCWGSDLTWQDGTWRSPRSTRSSAKDPHQLRLNSYRVLLSRGRDGLVVFVPAESNMDGTAEALINSGALPLSYTLSPVALSHDT